MRGTVRRPPMTIERAAAPSRRRRPAPLAAALVVVLAVAVLAAAPPPAAAQEVGTMVEVINQVTGTPRGGTPAAMAVGDDVLIEMKIEAGRASFAKMTFLEGGSLDVGAGTELVIDRATVDAATGASDSLLSVLVGKIRLALSSAFSGEVEIDTPTATIGVKGTILAVEPLPSGDTTVWVEEGVVEVTSKAGGTVEVRAGYLTTVRRGAPPTDPAPFDPESGAAAARALPPEFTPPSEDVFDDSPARPEGQDLPPRRDDNPDNPSNDPRQGGSGGSAKPGGPD